MRAVIFATALSLLPAAARADRREGYVLVSVEPVLLHATDAYDSAGAGTAPAGSLAVTAYYGITNTLHVGAAVRTTAARDVRVSRMSAPLADGTRPSGTLYEDLLGVSVGAVALYRVDTGYRTAPTLSVEAGFGSYSYSRRAHAPNGATYSVPVPSVSYLAPYLRPAIGLEYRMSDRLVAGVAVAVELAPGAHKPWALGVPFSFGLIW